MSRPSTLALQDARLFAYWNIWNDSWRSFPVLTEQDQTAWTEQLASVHSLQDYQMRFNANGINLEGVKSAKLLGTELHEHWNGTATYLKHPYVTVRLLSSVLRKMKHLAPFYARKQLTECLVLSRIGYNDVLLHQVPNYFINRLQRVHRQICRLVRYLEIGLAACQT